jgi:hypothetical protein
MFTADSELTLEIKHATFSQDVLRRLMFAVLISVIVWWSIGIYIAVSSGADSTTPVHHVNSTCGGVMTPC